MHHGMIAVHLKKMGVMDTQDSAQVSLCFGKVSEKTDEEFMACHFLRAMDWDRHGALVVYLENQYTLGVDMYPKNITVAYNLAIK